MAIIKPQPEEPAMSRDIDDALLNNLAPVEPEPARREKMRANILARAKQHRPKSFVTVRSDEGEWFEVMAGINAKRLIENDRVRAWLYRMAPGSFFPGHDHPFDEECICLEGVANFGGTVVRAGDFHLAPRGVPHGRITSEEGCLLYVRTAVTEEIC
jgi:quercetin dioxygenase-like cupin family protein